MKSQFDFDYFERGAEAGVSNFTSYRWLPDSTLAWAHTFRRLLDIKESARVLDVGAAKGFYVKALRLLGVDAYGYDVSEYAISNCDEAVRPYMSNHLNGAHFDLVYAKDVAEHIPPVDLEHLLKYLLGHTERLFLIVPLAVELDGSYVHEKEEHDCTHVNRWTLENWINIVGKCSPNFITSGSYMYPGLKPGAYEVERGYGFILSTKI